VGAQQAGALPYRQLLAAVRSLAGDADGDVMAAAMEPLAAARAGLLWPDGHQALERLAGRLFRPAFDRLGWDPRPGEPEQAQHDRAHLAAFLFETARDPEVRREAAARGARLLGLFGRPPEPGAISADLTGVALEAAVQELGAPAFDAVVALLPDAEGDLREQLIAAAGATFDPALAARARRLWRDGGLRGGERWWVHSYQGKWPELRQDVLADLEQHLDALLEALPEDIRARLPHAVATLCDPAAEARVAALFAPRLARWPELERSVTVTRERIRRCAAEREADGAAARAAVAE
jgi:hypothetical protein